MAKWDAGRMSGVPYFWSYREGRSRHNGESEEPVLKGNEQATWSEGFYVWSVLAGDRSHKWC